MKKLEEPREKLLKLKREKMPKMPLIRENSIMKQLLEKIWKQKL